MIQVLPGHISNLIAAGEVVQRPASVVKELMENAVDAGATSVHVLVKDSGRTLIQVIDNGCGMSPQDAVTAFKRHATSKICTIEDLNTILTFGFRGEALASVCSVAEVTLRTKREEDPIGTEVKYAESKLMSQTETATPNGSNFIVRNLFYNVPARRKFLKSDSTELRQIVNEFSRVALTRPTISFKLTHNGTDMYNLSPAPLKKRIQEIAGREIQKELVDISVNTSIITISGFIGRPEDARKTQGNQYLFANNRFFRSSYFMKAILKGYEGLIPEGHMPSFFIYFETNPNRLDVNIHPSKTEIKFQDDFAIFDILHSATRESLGKNSFMPSIDFDMEGAPEIPKIDNSRFVPPPKIDYDPLFNPFTRESSRESRESTPIEYQTYQTFDSRLFGETESTRKPVLQVAGKFLITTIKSGMVLIDIRRARERILYEKYLNSLTNEETLVQQSLFPVTVSLRNNIVSLLSDNSDTLAKMGFNLTIEDNLVTVNTLPEGFNHSSESLGAVLDQLAYELSEDGRDFGNKPKERVAQQLARSGSLGKIEHMNTLEAQALIDTLFACNEPTRTPHGKLCMRVISAEELENKLL